nr:hypothetical protein [Planctomycetota bacterium]
AESKSETLAYRAPGEADAIGPADAGALAVRRGSTAQAKNAGAADRVARQQTSIPDQIPDPSSPASMGGLADQASDELVEASVPEEEQVLAMLDEKDEKKDAPSKRRTPTVSDKEDAPAGGSVLEERVNKSKSEATSSEVVAQAKPGGNPSDSGRLKRTDVPAPTETGAASMGADADAAIAQIPQSTDDAAHEGLRQTSRAEQEDLAKEAGPRPRAAGAAAPAAPAPAADGAPVMDAPAAIGEKTKAIIPLTLAIDVPRDRTPLLAQLRVTSVAPRTPIPRAALALEGLDAAGAICWRHPTGLPTEDTTLASPTVLTLELELSGVHAPPPAAIRLRLRLGTATSAACLLPKRE